MKLSVIIVSYNVRYFLEKCIGSIYRALDGIEGEVIVVDNFSSDHSTEIVRSLFPETRLIVNGENKGFAKACNQGLSICKGEYALLLNPDTLVSEDTFKRCIEFMDAHPDASACGVRMVDGTGSFLPESMRGIPTPLSAFFKMTGISRLFPGSMLFNGYYMGGLDPEQIHQVPVLTGAFMFMRMSVISEVGMLDEDYFMYGEDIDLCHRMLKGGYQNYYLPGPSIIHYKGESTHRGSIRYVIHFYRAMMIYVSKHVHGVGGRLFRFMIILGVIVRGLIGGVRRLIIRAFPIFIDAGLIVGIMLLVVSYWAKGYFHDADHFDAGFYSVNFPLYTGIWLLFLFLSGAHDVQRNTRRICYGMTLGLLAILVVYAILPLQYRSSRAIIFIAAPLITIGMVLWTEMTNYLKERWRSPRRMVIVGSSMEVDRIMELMNRVGASRILVGWIATREEDDGPARLGYVTQMDEIVLQHRIGEVIFSAADMSFGEINAWMSRLGPSLAYRISSGGSRQIVGSDSKKEQGSLYTADVEFTLAYPSYRRAKRIFDVAGALAMLCLWPVAALWWKKGRTQFRKVISVLKGDKTWIGYHPTDVLLGELPALKPGVFSIGTGKSMLYDGSEIHMINYIYAREYHVWKDIDLFLRNISKLI
jgi:GT2 family glycosyltransferase